jgi:uncharacterized secreted protein with C-terminal beta-propeller domain
MTPKGSLSLVFAVLAVAAILAAGCTGPSEPPADAGIQKFGSAEEIRQYIEENTKLAAEAEGINYGGDFTGRDITIAPPQMAVAEAASLDSAKTAAPGWAGASDYSQTNVQVAGVDEPDYVKNDGKYIYVLSGTTLTIVDAYPAASAAIVSKTELDNTPKEIFLSGNRLVLLMTGTGSRDDYSGSVDTAAMKVMPYYWNYRPVTQVVFYDISDRKNPRVTREYEIDGDYSDARLIGNDLYLVTREQAYVYRDEEIRVPCLKTGGSCVVTPEVYYFRNPERSYTFTTVSSFDVARGTTTDAKTYLVGSGNIIYVSPDAMYISYPKYHNVYRRGGIEPVVMVEDMAESPSGTGSGSSPVLWEDFNRMSEAEKQRIIAEMKAQEEEKLQKNEIDQSTTVIHKIAIGNGAIAYRAQGEVPGSLKNQFAMDEYNDNLRVATTSNVYTRHGSYEYNNVFVLDSGMKTIGELTHIAEQETIYSTRFMGDRLYMVTFKRIDPFFVIDLATPTKPKVLGKLKIPGYSDYLHPYDKDYIIGVGKETGTNEWGGVSTQGIKLALFDVRDVENPRQVGKVEIGDAGSDSAALSDHKAFLFSREKNLLVIPARVVKQETGTITRTEGKSVTPSVWYGAYVFGIDPQTGFVLKGTVEHGTQGESYYWYGGSKNEVKRSLYIGNTLYTLSTAKILANPLDALQTTVATIPLLDTRDDVLYPDVLVRGE